MKIAWLIHVLNAKNIKLYCPVRLPSIDFEETRQDHHLRDSRRAPAHATTNSISRTKSWNLEREDGFAARHRCS